MSGKSFSPRDGWALEQTPQESGQSTRPDTVKAVLDNVLRHMM